LSLRSSPRTQSAIGVWAHDRNAQWGRGPDTQVPLRATATTAHFPCAPHHRPRGRQRVNRSTRLKSNGLGGGVLRCQRCLTSNHWRKRGSGASVGSDFWSLSSLSRCSPRWLMAGSTYLGCSENRACCDPRPGGRQRTRKHEPLSCLPRHGPEIADPRCGAIPAAPNRSPSHRARQLRVPRSRGVP
jgi:hypothetical protein